MPLDEDCDDYRVLARNMTRVLLDISAERERREAGLYDGPTRFFRAGLAACDPQVTGYTPQFKAPGDVPPAPISLTLTAPAGPASRLREVSTTALAAAPMPAAAASAPSPALSVTPAAEPAPPVHAPAPAPSVVVAVFAPPAAAAAAAPIASVASAVPVAEDPDQPARRVLTVSAATDAYVAARSRGLRTFRPSETEKLPLGAAWAKNSAANVRGTGRLMVALLGDCDLRRSS